MSYYSLSIQITMRIVEHVGQHVHPHVEVGDAHALACLPIAD